MIYNSPSFTRLTHRPLHTAILRKFLQPSRSGSTSFIITIAQVPTMDLRHDSAWRRNSKRLSVNGLGVDDPTTSRDYMTRPDPPPILRPSTTFSDDYLTRREGILEEFRKRCKDRPYAGQPFLSANGDIVHDLQVLERGVDPLERERLRDLLQEIYGVISSAPQLDNP